MKHLSIGQTLKKFPVTCINGVLVACLCLGLAKPLAQDFWTLHGQGETRVLAVSGFFDFGSFMTSLTGLLGTLSGILKTFTEARVAGFEKKTAADKELVQAGLNYQAADESSKAAVESFNMVGVDSPEACTIMLDTIETSDAVRQTNWLARARTQYAVRRSLYNPSAAASANELLRASSDEYCSPESFERGACKSGVSSKNMPDADIHANTIMGSSDTSGASQKLSDNEIDAANKYINWVSDPVPFEMPPLASMNTPAGQRIALEMRHRAAIAASAQFSLNRIIASRVEKK